MDVQHLSVLAAGLAGAARPGDSTWRADALTPEQRAFRAELGLTPDRPVVMSGHQAGIWHPGILAKYAAMVAIAERCGAQAAWLVVDQDVNDAASVRYPVLIDDAKGRRLETRTWAIGGAPAASAIETAVPTGRRAAVRVTDMPADARAGGGAAPGVVDGLNAIRAAMQAHAGAASVAHQVAMAVVGPGGLAEKAVRAAGQPATPVRVIFASDVARTGLMRRLAGAMASDPAGTRATYNRAVQDHGGADAGVRELGAGELPVWRIGREIGAERRGGTDADVRDQAAVSAGEIVPRALLLTGLMRAAGCDGFIHGTGGAGRDGESGYDAVTQAWLHAWIGMDVAPMAMVTATLRLRMRLGRALPTVEEAQRVVWAARKAEHFPDLLEQAGAAAERAKLVERLTALRRKRDAAGHAERKRLYRELHALLDAARERGGAALERWREQAERARRDVAQAAIAEDRTWAFPMYEPDQLRALATEATEHAERAMSGLGA